MVKYELVIKGAEIMRKTFTIEDLDCAHCAAKIEEEIKKTDGVIYINVNFLAQKITLEAKDEDFDNILCKVVEICKNTEPDCNIIF